MTNRFTNVDGAAATARAVRDAQIRNFQDQLVRYDVTGVLPTPLVYGTAVPNDERLALSFRYAVETTPLGPVSESGYVALNDLRQPEFSEYASLTIGDSFTEAGTSLTNFGLSVPDGDFLRVDLFFNLKVFSDEPLVGVPGEDYIFMGCGGWTNSVYRQSETLVKFGLGSTAYSLGTTASFVFSAEELPADENGIALYVDSPGLIVDGMNGTPIRASDVFFDVLISAIG